MYQTPEDLWGPLTDCNLMSHDAIAHGAWPLPMVVAWFENITKHQFYPTSMPSLNPDSNLRHFLSDRSTANGGQPLQL